MNLLETVSLPLDLFPSALARPEGAHKPHGTRSFGVFTVGECA